MRDRAPGAKTDTVHQSGGASRPNVPVTSQRRRHRVVPAAAAMVVAVIGVGAYWLRLNEEPAVADAEPQATLAARGTSTEVADAKNRALPKGRPPVQTATARPDREPATTESPVTSQPGEPKPMTPRAGAVPAVVTPASLPGPTREVSAVPNAAAPSIARRADAVVATEPAPAKSPAPIGPFFETRDVNESPRIATRVEPRVPGTLRARSINEIVVVRALVSQSGSPSRISLLRRSKTGPELDAVVIAAVNQWRFAPAKKKGEAVSCWFNFAVQVGRHE